MSNQRMTTPKGTAIFPSLHAPDTKFDAAGVYSVKLRFEGKAADMMKARLDDLQEASREAAIEEILEKGKAKSRAAAEKKLRVQDPYQMELDEDGEETGAIIVNFKCKASGIRKDGSKWTRTVPIFDGRGKSVQPGLKIGGGSILKVSFTPNLYYMAAIGYGVSCRLEAVQVIELQTWGGSTNPDAFGFEEEEDAFDAATVDDSVYAGTASDESEFDEDDDEVEGEIDF